jgi:ParB-like chromosome segregation protein Spo0J
MAVRLNICLDLILPAEDYHPNPGKVADMKMSIAKHGMKTPIKIRLCPVHQNEPIHYVVVDGHVRLYAAHLLGWSYVPCSVAVDLLAPDYEPIALPDFLKRSEGVSA